ncbi:hypothetical protein PR048_018206 [Dryococelus australis]|uniref:Uncharacterized protein n=1 Tax=Dryococelus australis TaxID=614101 RepID=A0ABQ9HBT3_9NEOP|nr:hypothetical protein PR048_018206 [Dryococelus australis]
MGNDKDNGQNMAQPNLMKNNWRVCSRRATAALKEKNRLTEFEVEMSVDQQRLNRTVLSFLFKAVSGICIEDIGNCEMAQVTWEILELIHTSCRLLHTMRPVKEMLLSQKTADVSVLEHTAKIQSYNRQICQE